MKNIFFLLSQRRVASWSELMWWFWQFNWPCFWCFIQFFARRVIKLFICILVWNTLDIEGEVGRIISRWGHCAWAYFILILISTLIIGCNNMPIWFILFYTLIFCLCNLSIFCYNYSPGRYKLCFTLAIRLECPYLPPGHLILKWTPFH